MPSKKQCSIDLSAHTVALVSDCTDLQPDLELHCPHMACETLRLLRRKVFRL